MAASAEESNQSVSNIFEEFREWISGKNLIIPILVGCFVYSICICTIGDVEDKKEEIKRNFEREKFALILVSLLFLGVFVYHLVKWMKAICCGWNNKTILRINSDGRWEYAPSIKRNEAHKCK